MSDDPKAGLMFLAPLIPFIAAYMFIVSLVTLPHRIAMKRANIKNMRKYTNYIDENNER